MKNDNCSCKTTAEACRTTAGERPRYFPRQLVTAEDMMMEQEYFRNRLRLHNRLLHGWGVVCGLQVAPVAKKDGSGGLEPWMVKVCPGHALGPYGDDIMVPCEVEIDLRQDSVSGSSVEPCGSIGDVWCSDAWWDRSQEQMLYIAIKYAEVSARPVRVQPAGCGCDDSACEFSRLRDGYVVKVLTAAEYRQYASDPAALPDWRELFKKDPPRDPNPACWPCPEQPWVALACITMDATGKITLIDNCGPRRLVAALGCFYWSCAGNVMVNLITITDVNGIQVTQLIPGQDYTITVIGSGFQTNLKVNLGAGISVRDIIPVSDTLFMVHVHVSQNAQPGGRDLVVVNPDCSTVIKVGALTVGSAAARIMQSRTQPTREAPGEEAKTASTRAKSKKSAKS